MRNYSISEYRIQKRLILPWIVVLVGLLLFVGITSKHTLSSGIQGVLAAGIWTGIWWGIVMFVSIRVPERVKTTRITIASWITIIRGGITGVFIGILAAGNPSSSTGLIVATLFAVIGLLDLVDGYVARTTDAVTDIGARLDTEADALLVLTGSIFVVWTGIAPALLLAVGVARYLYVAGLWIRNYFGWKIYDETNRQLNRICFAMVLIAIWIGLLLGSESQVVSSMFLIVSGVFLVNFVRSWIVTMAHFRE